MYVCMNTPLPTTYPNNDVTDEIGEQVGDIVGDRVGRARRAVSLTQSMKDIMLNTHNQLRIKQNSSNIELLVRYGLTGWRAVIDRYGLAT